MMESDFARLDVADVTSRTVSVSYCRMPGVLTSILVIAATDKWQYLVALTPKTRRYVWVAHPPLNHMKDYFARAETN